MADAIDRTVRAQGGAPVSPRQVRSLIVAASRAYDVQRRAGLVDDGEGFDTWRKGALHDVVGAGAPDSFKAITQHDYAAVLDYFARLGDGEAHDAGALTSGDERCRAFWSLKVEEGLAGDCFGGEDGARRYADALFRKIHRCARHEATARQVWAVIFTLRNRAARMRSKTAPGTRGAEGVHSARPDRSGRFPAFSRGSSSIPRGGD